MQSPADTNSLLILQFRQFHRELLQILARLNGSGSPASQAGSLQGESVSSEEVAQRLLTLMNVQALGSGRNHTAAQYDLYREMQYVMAALADELILSSNWKGKSNWVLLETRLFQSHASGEIFFKRLDEILREPVSSFKELERIYFYALSLGFCGKYRDRDDHGRLAQYRQKLFLRIYQEPVKDLATVERQQLFPQSYDFTLGDHSVRRMPGTRIWVLCLITVLVLWIAASDALWRQATAQVSAEIRHIQRNVNRVDRTSNAVSSGNGGATR